MEWHVFDEASRRRSFLDFRLPLGSRRDVPLSVFRGRQNLVLFFLHGTDCPICRAALRVFARTNGVFAEQEAALMPIFASSPEAVGAIQLAESLPFPLLADPDGKVRRAYTTLLPGGDRKGVGVFVLDRFGGLYAGSITDEPDPYVLDPEIESWLAYIEIQCPECGVSEWPIPA